MWFVLVSYGGLPFRHFLLAYSGHTYFTRFNRAMKKVGPGGRLPDEDMAFLINKCGVKFYGYVVSTMGCLTTKVNSVLFQMSFISQYHGMSRSGLDIFARMGYMCGLRTFDALKREALLAVKARQR